MASRFLVLRVRRYPKFFPSIDHEFRAALVCSRVSRGLFRNALLAFLHLFCGISRVLSTGAPLSMAEMGKPRLRCRLGAARLGNWRYEDTGGGGAVGGRTRR